MKIKNAFTLAEALLALTIVGIIAAITIPSVVSSHRALQHKTAYKKAIKTMNETISLNIAKGKKSAIHTTKDKPLYEYLQNNLEIIKTSSKTTAGKEIMSFYTADGMRFDFPKQNSDVDETLYIIDNNNSDTKTKLNIKTHTCGTKGLGIGGGTKALNEDPCVIVVDVNGDKSPNKITTSFKPEDKNIKGEMGDIFYILVTDKSAIPYGDFAQQAFYGK